MRTENRGISVSEPSGAVVPSAGTVTHSSSPDRSLSDKWFSLRLVLFAVLAISGVCWDLWTKWAIFDWLKCPGQHPVWNGPFLGMSVEFDLATTFNHGALWGIGQNQTWLFATLSFFAIAAIGYFLWTRQATATWWLTIASSLLLAGTLGNLYDRLGLHGWRDDKGAAVYAVRDFLNFVFFGTFHWATFNFADVFLVTGAIMLMLQSLWTPVEETVGKPSDQVVIPTTNAVHS